MYGTSLDCENGTRGWFSQNAKSHSTATGPWTVHLAVPSRGHHLWQVGDGALSVDAYVLSPGGPHDPPTIETTPPDERRHDFWHVHSHAYGGSHEGPRGRPRKGQTETLAPATNERGGSQASVVGQPSQSPEATEATGYKKGTTLNPRDKPHHVAPTV